LGKVAGSVRSSLDGNVALSDPAVGSIGALGFSRSSWLAVFVVKKNAGAIVSFSPAGECKHREFLTEETSCPTEISKSAMSEKIWQKRPPLSGDTLGQVTFGTCRLGRSRQGGAAVGNAGR
jgi:hypothetical protein